MPVHHYYYNGCMDNILNLLLKFRWKIPLSLSEQGLFVLTLNLYLFMIMVFFVIKL